MAFVYGAPDTSAVGAERSNIRTCSRRYRQWRHTPKSTARAPRLRMAASQSEPTPLAELEFVEYISDEGLIPYDDSKGKIGVYAIYNSEKQPVFLGKSRDVKNSLRMHLVKMPEECYYYKVMNVAKPSRTAFDEMINAWCRELGGPPVGNDNGDRQSQWENPIDVRHIEHTEEEKEALANMDVTTEFKTLKKICRRVQADIEAQLKQRNVKEPMRFDPKLKDKGLLDLQSIRLEIPSQI
eukprot:Plantae.Rhodophyta-Purpureofilum_apyrenoidigerum.ctg13475.p1 GENE.Plantae.Rhodophyta-Purpureofilum_apyrenoidigerum.ctg13475~~Plantae.Rhodophyta-Purpureofilum_apyrenoidigerum.ctg13475.p1  ORF type:complete len:239 (+),score=49.39 Plantae.Rhodophyta-Purpureofilum_apyrenoidigerum.ctg13475:132-848(+)